MQTPARLGRIAALIIVIALLWPQQASAQDATVDAETPVAWLDGSVDVDGPFVSSQLAADTLDVTFLVPRAVSNVDGLGLLDVASLFSLVPSHDGLPELVLDDAVQGGLTVTAAVADDAEAVDPAALLGDELTFTWIAADAVHRADTTNLGGALSDLQGPQSAVTCWGTLDGKLPDSDDVDAVHAARACGQGAALLIEGTQGHALIWDGPTPGISLSAEGVDLVSSLDGVASWRLTSSYAYADLGEAYVVATGEGLDIVAGDLHAQDHLQIVALPGITNRFDIEQTIDFDRFLASPWFAAASGVTAFDVASHAPTGATSASWTGAFAEIGWSIVDAAEIHGTAQSGANDLTGHELAVPSDVSGLAAQSADLSFADAGKLALAEGFIGNDLADAGSPIGDGIDAYGTAFGTLLVAGAVPADASTLIGGHDLHFDHIPFALSAWDDVRQDAGAVAGAAQSGDPDKLVSTLSGSFLAAPAGALVDEHTPGALGPLAAARTGLDTLFQGRHTAVASGIDTGGLATVYPGPVPADAGKAIALTADHGAVLRETVDGAAYHASGVSDVGFTTLDVPEAAVFIAATQHVPVIVTPGADLDVVPLSETAFLLIESGSGANTAWLLSGDIGAVANDASAFAVTGDAVVQEIPGLVSLVGIGGLRSITSVAELAALSDVAALGASSSAVSGDLLPAQLETALAAGAIDVLAYADGAGLDEVHGLHGTRVEQVAGPASYGQVLAALDIASASSAQHLFALVHVGDVSSQADLDALADRLAVYANGVAVPRVDDPSALLAQAASGEISATSWAPVVLDDRVAVLVASPLAELDGLAIVDPEGLTTAASGATESPVFGPIHVALLVAGLAMVVGRRRE